MPRPAIVRRALIAALLVLASRPVNAQPLPAGFVRLRDLAPTIAQDVRYATPFNFTGAVVPGYGRGECVLTREAANALIRVEQRLAQQGYGLKLFDCYRPARAVSAFNNWVKRPGATDLGRIFHPGIARSDLVAKGYIAGNSSHSRGSTVDVGLIRAGEAPLPTPENAGPCDGAQASRPHETSLDLGTSFDCFSEKSALRHPGVTAEARRNREILATAMSAEGFRGYSKEWWHFTLAKEPFPKTPFDFAIE
ncbi:D-alanyl-D-alanine dipeptidase [Bosea sp. 62]|uniref:M15 family metallopeptidase n=1 Tax=unclassified Bosea (in: a-proteobacteria) TaxID=2653178 RepID=UPI00125111D5|nr:MULTISPECIES: M15 family metallopeptidase [unclassified Bosea (in: a-proteobacteria)]CAD5252660.1 D-alanyl-D-alanine dipeptidase [Bosea sp. 7B]CAD5278684.1 D-alanyl-D-alanine dipeptidase [Bosea sp. 21B]CAD5279801.1 D-alanyl-D-alanine dipeptidase [Bosea sp. 46]VVT59623.1 D-alanyl-D-alanine dipeptidase [Bosea sp. EC-HK365B]VXB36644.1 D-alanyl-D-alanine dipeptidase [Bosea sp. 62]